MAQRAPRPDPLREDAAAFPRNTLFYGDNLDWLRDRGRFPDACVDLIYLDPPFNSNRDHNILFKDRAGSESAAQVRAFEDSWEWGDEARESFVDLTERGFAPSRIQEVLIALRALLGENDLLAYLVMMAARLVELHRVLKPTGSLYLHCDPTASHYLKIMLDALFGPGNFRNEIVWRRYGAHNDGGQGSRHFGRVHDVLLFYTKGAATTWQQPYMPYDREYVEQNFRLVEEESGRRFATTPLTGPGGAAKGNPVFEWNGHTRAWRFGPDAMQRLHDQGRLYYSRTGYARQKLYLDEAKGVPVQDVWGDVPALSGNHAERLGYPTQKPLALLERIIAASSSPGDVVLDPFCGCGTAVVAAQRLGRRWVGIDVTILAVDLIRKRIESAFSSEVANAIDLYGIPNEPAAARALFEKDPFEFERWVVTMVDGQPNERSKQRGDHGIDGVVRFAAEFSREGLIRRIGRSLVSVKGGQQLNTSMVRDLRGTVEREHAEMGLLLTLNQPTAGMRDEARRAGRYVWSWNNAAFPKLQIATVEDLLSDRKPEMPLTIPPYTRAQRIKMDAGQLALF